MAFFMLFLEVPADPWPGVVPSPQVTQAPRSFAWDGAGRRASCLRLLMVARTASFSMPVMFLKDSSAVSLPSLGTILT